MDASPLNVATALETKSGGPRRGGEPIRAARALHRIKHDDGSSSFYLPKEPGFYSGSFDCAAGARDYRLFIPTHKDRTVQGLIVMLHGCTQSPEDLAAGTDMNALAETHGFIVVYPRQSESQNPMLCWNWYRAADQSRGVGEPGILAMLADDIRREFSLPNTRVFAAGISAGGAMAAILSDAYPDLFAAVGIHSGIAPGAARDLLGALAAMRGDHLTGINWRLQADSTHAPRVIVFQGEADRVVHPSNARSIIGAARQFLPEGRLRTETGISEDGRSYQKLTQSHPDGSSLVEAWLVDRLGHAWSGGRRGVSFTEQAGPAASVEMVRFFQATTASLEAEGPAAWLSGQVAEMPEARQM